MQVEYSNPGELYPWIERGPPIAVKAFTYDHLTQTIRIGDQRSRISKAPVLRSFLKNEQALNNRYRLRGSDDTCIVGNPPSTRATDYGGIRE
jgi:hypothetical protein